LEKIATTELKIENGQSLIYSVLFWYHLRSLDISRLLNDTLKYNCQRKCSVRIVVFNFNFSI
jgi:hypothetical protein